MSFGRDSLLPVIAGLEARPAVFGADGEPVWTRAELRARAADIGGHLVSPTAKAVFLLGRNDPPSLAALLGVISAGHAVALLDETVSPAVIAALARAYCPDAVIAPANTAAGLGFTDGWRADDVCGMTLLLAPTRSGAPIGGDLAILLSTSGTTGSAKFVRLSMRNVIANADQIAASLSITPRDVGIAHLPLHYSYGLSVVTSHLRVGAAVHLWPETTTVPEFWQAVARSGGTHFPGVPFHYGFLARGDIAKIAPASVRTFTQAGGALDPRLQARMHRMLDGVGGRFIVMYGQTEAAPRMTALAHEDLPAKLGSVGLAMPGGRITVIGDGDALLRPGEVGRIVFEGPNVMMGYAECRADLALGDVVHGRLDTGDIGRLDEDGFLFLTGRAKRFAKVFGLRLGLDEIEARFAEVAEVAATDAGDKVLLHTTDGAAVSGLVASVAAEYKLPSSVFSVRVMSELPRKSNGKTDYQQLAALP